jgi:hypothetical protein
VHWNDAHVVHRLLVPAAAAVCCGQQALFFLLSLKSLYISKNPKYQKAPKERPANQRQRTTEDKRQIFKRRRFSPYIKISENK